MTVIDTSTEIPGYISGTWAIDPVHSEVSFTVRHLMVSKVRGRFTRFAGTFVTGEDPLESSVEATVELASIDTDNADRDAHIRSADFFDVERYPTLTYRSTGIRRDGDGFIVDGELSLHGVTRSVPLTERLPGEHALRRHARRVLRNRRDQPERLRHRVQRAARGRRSRVGQQGPDRARSRGGAPDFGSLTSPP